MLDSVVHHAQELSLPVRLEKVTHLGACQGVEDTYLGLGGKEQIMLMLLLLLLLLERNPMGVVKTRGSKELILG